ncbi:MAG: winged helix-turn-helix transcriptional regulator, partial [Clostridia bacterium]|nr:winged helix-turn-helix transcriptional regulator [Clostridia bacterium]
MNNLTQKEREIFEYISDCLQKNGFAPSVRDICAEVGIKSTSSVHEYLRRLEAKGFIRKSSGKSRALSIQNDGKSESGKMKRVPILGKV